MSLLDDVSIVVTPNGYKAGELYAVVPVPTEGAEEISCGDFECADPDAVWTRGTGWTISGGSANCDGSQTGTSNLYQYTGSLSDKIVKITFTISNYSAGYLDTSFFGASGTANARVSANGDYIFYISIQSGHNGNTGFSAHSSFIGSIDNVSVKEYTSADMDVTRATSATRVDENGLVNYAEVLGGEEVTNGDFSNGLTGFGTQIPSGQTVEVTSNQLHINYDSTATQGSTGVNQTILTAGKQYKITIDVASITGTFRVQAGGQVQDIDTSGIHTFYKTPTSTILYIIRQSNAVSCEFRLNSVSVKEVTRDNVPRIDYTGGGCPHILAEPQRTNLVTYSSDFSQWSTIGSPQLTSNYGVSPDGTENSTRIQFSTSDRIYISVSASGDIAYSVYLKGVGQVKLRDNDGSNTKDITLTSEWIRYEFIFNDTITNIQIQQAVGTSDLQIYGAQLEIGSFPTSYIPTSGSTVTRNQDQFTRDGIGSLINSTEGVFFAEFKPKLSSDFSVLTLNNNSSQEIVFIGKYNNTNTMFVGLRHLFSYSILYTSSSQDLTIFNKVAVKWKSGDMAVWVNGVEVLTSTSTDVPIGMTELSFDFSLNQFPFYGEVKQLQVYKTALTDEQLIQLTGESGTDFYESYAEMAAALNYTIQ